MHRKAGVKGVDSEVLLKYKQQFARKRSGEESEDRENTEETDRGRAGKSVVLLFLSFRTFSGNGAGKGSFDSCTATSDTEGKDGKNQLIKPDGFF